MTIRYVLINLDRARKLRFDPNAIADVEGALGMGISRIFREDMMGIRVLRALVWAGLKWEDRGLTLERTGVLIGNYLGFGGKLTDLTRTVMEAVEASGWISGEADDEEEGVAPALTPADSGNAQGA